MPGSSHDTSNMIIKIQSSQLTVAAALMMMLIHSVVLSCLHVTAWFFLSPNPSLPPYDIGDK